MEFGNYQLGSLSLVFIPTEGRPLVVVSEKVRHFSQYSFLEVNEGKFLWSRALVAVFSINFGCEMDIDDDDQHVIPCRRKLDTYIRLLSMMSLAQNIHKVSNVDIRIPAFFKYVVSGVWQVQELAEPTGARSRQQRCNRQV